MSRARAVGGRGCFDRVVGLGLCVRDEVFLVDDFGLQQSRTRYREHVRLPGGMVATAVAQAAVLGCDAHLLSLLGRDADGGFVLRELRERGVVTRRVVRSDQHPTTTALVLVHRRSGERRFVVPDRRPIERDAPDFDLAPIRRGALLLIDGHFPGQVLRAVHRARDRDVPVIADFAAARPAFVRLLRYVDYPIVPLEFVESLGVGGPREALRHLRERYGGTPIVTLGARGALVLHQGRFRRVPSPRVEVVDTTGAGDVFHGAFAAALVHGRGVLDAAALAARAAAMSCRALGGVGALMTRREMQGPAGGERV